MKKIINFLQSILSENPLTTITAEDHKNLVIVDVRTVSEYERSHVQGSLNIDFYNPKFKDEISILDKKKTYKVYCRSGNRSGQAEMIMKQIGFEDVENIGSLAQAAKRLNRTCVGKLS